jgi:hypothetical protein
VSKMYDGIRYDAEGTVQPHNNKEIPAMAEGQGEPWTVTPSVGDFGICKLGLSPATSDSKFEGSVPDFGLTRENALALADAIRELYGIKPDNKENSRGETP